MHRRRGPALCGQPVRDVLHVRAGDRRQLEVPERGRTFSSAIFVAANGVGLYVAPPRFGIVPAPLGNDASLLGAAELALEPVLDEPAVLVGPREAAPELISS